ncbi:threonine/serine exporter family protein [Salirhabdus sp. Marseille-P4669]|uniref:threonine/serine exporter family protein n=1 Tax=Salirhabdus sp. Marseille-P4669 TaxID=2042310 RepID=UPI000C7CDFB5|nr:threonine/serine exporter family protein [Salirhabdus sp. Marseille-P4669]
MLQQLFTSFIAAAAFGIIFNAPKQSLWKCGVIGSIGWGVYYYLYYFQELNIIGATFIASFMIAVISQFFAKWYKTPMIIFSVAGIIPLVPGGLSYDAMRKFVENDYNQATQLAAKVFMISGAIAMGLVLAEVINQVVKQSTIQRYKQNVGD